MLELESVFEKLLLISGTSGVDLREIYQRMSSSSKCVYHFEEVFREVNGGSWGDIEQAVSLLLISRPQASEQFRRALDAIVERAKASGCSRLTVFAHLTYLSRGVIIGNPSLIPMLSIASETTIVYLVDDFYDVMARLLERIRGVLSGSACCRPPSPPYQIDPATYLSWRAADMNILAVAEGYGDSVEVLLFAVKHPPETWSRLVEHARLTRRERLLERRYKLVYASHPITAYRAMYARGAYRSMSDNPLVAVVEAFKSAVRRDPGVVLFEPTTIDELLEDPAALIEKTVEDALGCERRKSRARQTVYHAVYVSPRNRWPLPRDTLWESTTGKSYHHRKAGINILDPDFKHLYGEKIYRALAMDACNAPIPDNDGRMGGVLGAKLASLIEAQIEARDYQYVAQSDATIAINTLVIADYETLEKAAGPEVAREAAGAYIARSTGMEGEIRRARAHAKPVILHILPVCIGALLGSSHSAQAVIDTLRDPRHFAKCTSYSETGLPASCGQASAIQQMCGARLQKGGLFAAIGAGVRVCIGYRVIETLRDLEGIEDSYFESLCLSEATSSSRA